MQRFFIVYTLLAASGLWMLQREFIQPAVEQFCLGLAILTGTLINLIDDSVIRTAAVLREQDTLFAIEVTVACSALSISWLYCAGLLAYPRLTLKQKFSGIALGLLLIQSINTIRIISLVYIGSWFERDFFDLIHEHLWPLLLHFIALLCLLYFFFQSQPTTQANAHA